MRTIWTSVCVICICSLAFGHSNNTTHGNNPTWQWVGVNIGGELFAMPGDEYLILSVLTDLDGLTMTSGNAQQCAELAILICGEGQICCYCFSGNGNQACSFSCQDSAGDCEPCPVCGPTSTLPILSVIAE